MGGKIRYVTRGSWRREVEALFVQGDATRWYIHMSEGPTRHPEDASMPFTRNGTIREEGRFMYEYMPEPVAFPPTVGSRRGGGGLEEGRGGIQEADEGFKLHGLRANQNGAARPT